MTTTLKWIGLDLAASGTKIVRGRDGKASRTCKREARDREAIPGGHLCLKMRVIVCWATFLLNIFSILKF